MFTAPCKLVRQLQLQSNDTVCIKVWTWNSGGVPGGKTSRHDGERHLSSATACGVRPANGCSEVYLQYNRKRTEMLYQSEHQGYSQTCTLLQLTYWPLALGSLQRCPQESHMTGTIL